MRVTLRRRIEKLEAQRRAAVGNKQLGYTIRVRETESPNHEWLITEEKCPDTGEIRQVIYINPIDVNI